MRATDGWTCDPTANRGGLARWDSCVFGRGQAEFGGTLLSGGVGYVAGTLMGVLIYGTILTAISFHGQLDSSWQRIAIGALLLVFIVIQRFLTRASSFAKAH